MDPKEINDFLDRFENLANTYIIDKLDELRQNVEDMNILYEDEYEIVINAIERTEDRVKKTLDEINEILTTWYEHRVLNRKCRFEPRSDIKDSLESSFKGEYERFINSISSAFENSLRLCNTPNRQIVNIVNHELLFDESINIVLERIIHDLMMHLRSITGVNEK